MNVIDSIVNAVRGTEPDLSEAATLAVIVREAGDSLCSPGELAQLRRVQISWLAGHTMMTSHTDDKIRRDLTAAREKMVDAVFDGSFNPEAPAPTREHLAQLYQERLEIGKRAMGRATQAGILILEPIAARFSATAISLADEIEEIERVTAARFHVPYTPGAAVTRLRQLAVSAPAAIYGSKGQPLARLSPASLAPFLEI